jgi:hypothetical protein
MTLFSHPVFRFLFLVNVFRGSRDCRLHFLSANFVVWTFLCLDVLSFPVRSQGMTLFPLRPSSRSVVYFKVRFGGQALEYWMVTWHFIFQTIYFSFGEEVLLLDINWDERTACGFWTARIESLNLKLHTTIFELPSTSYHAWFVSSIVVSWVTFFF